MAMRSVNKQVVRLEEEGVNRRFGGEGEWGREAERKERYD